MPAATTEPLRKSLLLTTGGLGRTGDMFAFERSTRAAIQVRYVATATTTATTPTSHHMAGIVRTPPV